MKGHVGSFLFGLGLAGAAAFLYEKYKGAEIDTDEIGGRVSDLSHDIADTAARMKAKVADVATAGTVGIVDLNQASAEDFERIGVHDQDMVERIIEGRPYRNKMDLLSRMIVPEEVYSVIKSHIEVHGAEESVKIA
jgi:DNA uptake protein ComE-like DNA-binding protein